jgi:putative transposase
MPWKKTCAMMERMKFVTLAELGETTMAGLCREFGISRNTGYEVLARYRTEGLDGLQDRSHAAINHPHAVSEITEARIVALRAEHPSWGPRKLRARLQMTDGMTRWPAASTIGEILRRHGLVIARRRRVTTPADMSPFGNCAGPNDTWCIDFKGWFRIQDGRRCDPLTISDAYSRYLLRCQVVRRADTQHVRPLLEATFREYGLPHALRSDNGPPFASRGVAGLSRLSVWCIRLGIKPERITPGRPAENGRHERLHGTLQREACEPPQANRRAQQQHFDVFRRIYNEERPHEAIANATPDMIYRPSLRSYPARLPEMVYPDHWQLRKVRPNGQIKWQGEPVFLGEALAGEIIGLEENDRGCFRLYFGPILLGTLNHACSFQRAGDHNRRRVALRSPMASRDAPPL